MFQRPQSALALRARALLLVLKVLSKASIASDFSTLFTHQARWKTKTMPSEIGFLLFRLWQVMYFSTKNPINKLAMNNRRLLIAAENTVLSWPPGVCFSQRWTGGKKIAQSFLSTANFITKYSPERFLSVWGQKIYLHEIRCKKTNIKYNNYSGLPFEMQLLKAIK